MQEISEYQLVSEAVAFIQSRMPYVPKVGIILGTGLGGWTKNLSIDHQIDIHEVPHMPVPHVMSHKGKLDFTRIGDVPVIISSSRIHYYEGHSMAAVVRQVRVLKTIGCTHLIITNAAGGINPGYKDGNIVLIRDHISLMPDNPLRGLNEDRWGPRFPDMKNAYDNLWRQFVHRMAEEHGIPLNNGIYAGNPGPALETPSEYVYLHRIGADLVGMSAVPEVQAAVHIGLKVLGISVVSNVCYPPERITETTVEDVIRVVEGSAESLGRVVTLALKYLE